jgi:hypothetical protein
VIVDVVGTLIEVLGVGVSVVVPAIVGKAV